MNKRHGKRAFTIIELLVVVSIIALLVGILLPAIGKARDNARVSVSKNNLRQAGVAHKTYAVDWADRHVTYVRDNLGLYDGDLGTYNDAVYGSGTSGLDGHPPIIAGWAYDDAGNYTGPWAYWPTAGNNVMFQPIAFPEGPGSEAFGWFRFATQPRAMNTYFNGRWHDPVFFAPKDNVLLEEVERCFEIPGEFVAFPSDECNPAWGSYATSAAGLFNPLVFSDDGQGNYWNAPWELPSGYKVPSFGQVRFPTLKTHMLEHHWLQDAKVPCNDAFFGCEPYYFNHSLESKPVTLFYDSSVRLMGVAEAMSSDARIRNQTSSGGGDGVGLWTRDTTFEEDGYLIPDGYDLAATSFHILTTEGVRGRDTVGKE